MKDLVESCKRSKALVKLKTLARDIRGSKGVQKLKELSKETLDKCFIRSSIASPFVPLLSAPETERSLQTDFLPLKQIFSLLLKRMQFNSRCLWAM
jgi:hypothetical protein